MSEIIRDEYESIPPALALLLRKLEFLSMINKGKKPCMNDKVFVDAATWTGMIYRFIRGENKSNMILHIQNTIEETVRGFNDYPLHKRILINTLIRTKSGIENLLFTYCDYPDVISAINVTLSNISIQERKYCSYIEKRIEESTCDSLKNCPTCELASCRKTIQVENEIIMSGDKLPPLLDS